MFTNNAFVEATTKTIRIPANEEDEDELFISSEIFLEFLRFCSCGKTTLTMANAISLMNLAQKYSVLALVDSCAHFIIKTISYDYEPAQVLDILSVARFYDFAKLTNKCEELVSRNTRNFLLMELSKDFRIAPIPGPDSLMVRTSLTIDQLNAVCQCSALSIHEDELLYCILAWIKAQENLDEQSIAKILENIRFPTLTDTALQDHLLPLLQTLSDFEERYKDRYVQALEFVKKTSKLTNMEAEDLPLEFRSRKMRLSFAFGNFDKSYPGYRVITWTELTDTLYDDLKLYYDAYGLVNLEYNAEVPYKSSNCCFKVFGNDGYVSLENGALLYPYDTVTKQQNCNGEYIAEIYYFSMNGQKVTELPERSRFRAYHGCQHKENPAVFVGMG